MPSKHPHGSFSRRPSCVYPAFRVPSAFKWVGTGTSRDSVSLARAERSGAPSDIRVNLKRAAVLTCVSVGIAETFACEGAPKSERERLKDSIVWGPDNPITATSVNAAVAATLTPPEVAIAHTTEVLATRIRVPNWGPGVSKRASRNELERNLNSQVNASPCVPGRDFFGKSHSVLFCCCTLKALQHGEVGVWCPCSPCSGRCAAV